MAWKLDDVENRHRRSATFWIPPEDMRVNLEPGIFAKLVFVQKAPSAGERMWVEISDVTGPGKYKGRLANNPVSIKGLEFGDEVVFEAKHVADIEVPGSPIPYPQMGAFEAFERWRREPAVLEPLPPGAENDPWTMWAPEELRRGLPVRRREEPGERRPYGGLPGRGPREWMPGRREERGYNPREY
jgi:hypothetical protein